MSDLIKREDAINVIWEYDVNPSADGMIFEAQSHIDRDIRLIPSADRPQGEWITEYNGTGWNDYWDYTCTNCKMKFPRADDVLQYAHYCPSCGARMKGADDE